jgi:hypothetical protein
MARRDSKERRSEERKLDSNKPVRAGKKQEARSEAEADPDSTDAHRRDADRSASERTREKSHHVHVLPHDDAVAEEVRLLETEDVGLLEGTYGARAHMAYSPHTICLCGGRGRVGRYTSARCT